MIENLRLMIAEFRLRFKKSEMPRIPFTLQLLRAGGVMSIRPVGVDFSTKEFVYTTQLRWWHPLTWFLFIGFAAAEGFLAAPQFFSRKEWRIYNG